MIRINVVITSFALSDTPCARKGCYLSHIDCPSLIFGQHFLIQNVLKLLESNEEINLHNANNFCYLKQRDNFINILDHLSCVLGLHQNAMLPFKCHGKLSQRHKYLKFSYTFFPFCVHYKISQKMCIESKPFLILSLEGLL